MAKNGCMRRLLALFAVVMVAAPGLILTSLPAAAGPKHGANKYAVLVGVDDYRGKVPDLRGSVGDVADIHKVLQANGWPASNVRILTNAQATLPAIRDAIQWMASKADDNSFSVFHYSGHIKQMTGDKDRDGEAQDEFLWPVDNGYLSDGEFSARMKQLRGWSWVNIAGCEAAGMNDGLAAFNRFFTGSSHEPEKSYEAPEWKNSVYGGLMADYGLLQRQGDLNHDGRISLQESFEYANRHAPRITAKQARGPQHPYRAGGDGTDWYFDTPRPPAPPAAKAPAQQQPPPQQNPPPQQKPQNPPPPPPSSPGTTGNCPPGREPGDDCSR